MRQRGRGRVLCFLRKYLLLTRIMYCFASWKRRARFQSKWSVTLLTQPCGTWGVVGVALICVLSVESRHARECGELYQGYVWSHGGLCDTEESEGNGRWDCRWLGNLGESSQSSLTGPQLFLHSFLTGGVWEGIHLWSRGVGVTLKCSGRVSWDSLTGSRGPLPRAHHGFTLFPDRVQFPGNIFYILDLDFLSTYQSLPVHSLVSLVSLDNWD